MSGHEHHGMKPLEGMSAYCRRGHQPGHQRDDRFGRLFPKLSPAYIPIHTLEAIGRKGGPMDGKSKNDRTDTVPVGMVFFGQFVDHDITLDASTTFDSVVDDPGEIANVRTPTLDLDCVYGVGPEAQPYLYEQAGAFAGAKLLTGSDNPGQAGERDH
ncbi:MAG: peroxidase, partial [Qipengyuania sp.]